MEKQEKKNKRIRHPKKKVQEEQQEEKKHFVLDVHDVTTSSKDLFGS